MPADYDFYTRLEPNHDVEVDEEGYQWVVCPFEQRVHGGVELHNRPTVRTASWSPNANPEEIDCPVCEVFRGELHYAGPPAHLHQGEDEADEEPPIAGGAHGEAHNVSEYAPCKVPLRRIELVRAVWITIHEGATASCGRFRDLYEAADGYNRYPIRQRDTAAYVCRRTISGRTWSKHSICAIDINWTTNPYGRTLRTDMPMWFVRLWLDEGWGWGGNWRSVKDAMHMSKFPNEGGDGLLYVGGWVAREDEVTPEDLKKIEELIDRKLDEVVGKPYREGMTVLRILTEKDEKTGEYVDGVKLLRGQGENVIARLERLDGKVDELKADGA